jgi:hypothetical protein
VAPAGGAVEEAREVEVDRAALGLVGLGLVARLDRVAQAVLAPVGRGALGAVLDSDLRGGAVQNLLLPARVLQSKT